MTITQNNTVAQVVAENIKAAHVFKKHGIDFCCGGGISIEKACEKNNVDFKTLEQDLLIVNELPNRGVDYNNWDLNFLMGHIINIHHSYVEESSQILLQYAEKVANVHGHHYTEVVQVHILLQDIISELASHMKKEELILFPYIQQLVEAEKAGTPAAFPQFGSVNNPIKMMESEHEHAGDTFKAIAKITNNYTPPEEACNTFRAFYALLDEFEQDLHQHIHLENNILHPKAKALEIKVMG
ncbi:MAG: iron-sulfur cluster repair di-iron protein [Flavobacteriaceae bacterium]|nr:iron-sulfur cluster repair di-iron protein [Flavobacteriaceae bacterium]